VPDALHKASDPLQALAAVECTFTVGGQAAVRPGLLRDVVIITAKMDLRLWFRRERRLMPVGWPSGTSASAVVRPGPRALMR
jgi:hypothetical protein